MDEEFIVSISLDVTSNLSVLIMAEKPAHRFADSAEVDKKDFIRVLSSIGPLNMVS